MHESVMHESVMHESVMHESVMHESVMHESVMHGRCNSRPMFGYLSIRPGNRFIFIFSIAKNVARFLTNWVYFKSAYNNWPIKYIATGLKSSQISDAAPPS